MQPNKQSRRDSERDAMREVSAMPTSSVVDMDPEDPSQLLDEAGQFGAIDMNVEAQPHAEVDADLDTRSDRESFADSELGEHAFETLEKKMAEGGATPEAELDIEDDSDAQRGHHKSMIAYSGTKTGRSPTDKRDKGSGGKAGL